jgi:ketosteroid isomerase-like protein
MSASLRKRVYEIYEAFSAGKLDLLADTFDENVDFRSTAPIEVFPYLGHRRGKTEVVKTLWAVHGEFAPVTFLPIWMVAQDDTAGVLLSMHATHRATGREIRLFASHFLRFRNDRIVEYRAIIDSFEAAQQVLGREFDVSKSPKSK